MILVTGANGQLGTELRHLLDERNEEYVAVDVALSVLPGCSVTMVKILSSLCKTLLKLTRR